MQIIPLVRAKYAYAFGAVLDQLGAPRQRLMERSGISEWVLENPEAILPAHQVWNFIGAVAQSEGIDDLGLIAGEMTIQEYGAFSQNLFQVPNLNQALDAFCQFARHEYSRADFYVSRSDQATWFCRGPIDGNETQKKHVELLVLSMMIATVRLVAGPNWDPPNVFLQTIDARRVEQHPLFSRSTVRFGNRVTSFEVPQSLLPQKLPAPTFPKDAEHYYRLNHQFRGAVRQIVDSMLADEAMKITSVAESIGLSVRTLQRQLSDVNTTFSQLLEDVRMQAALRMLHQTDHPMQEITQQLGYSDQAHFSRAFKRWTGLSPGAYRSAQNPLNRNQAH